MLEKNFIHRLDLKGATPKITFDKENGTFSLTENIAKLYVEHMDEIILETIYQAYKDTECDSIIVLDKSEFKKFLMKYMPIYLKERDSE